MIVKGAPNIVYSVHPAQYMGYLCRTSLHARYNYLFTIITMNKCIIDMDVPMLLIIITTIILIGYASDHVCPSSESV